MTLEQEIEIREKIEHGEHLTLDEAQALLTAHDMLLYENDFLHADHRMITQDNETLKEHCVRSNPALDFEIDSKWGNKTEN